MFVQHLDPGCDVEGDDHGLRPWDLADYPGDLAEFASRPFDPPVQRTDAEHVENMWRNPAGGPGRFRRLAS
jgi:hypothetical protein